MNTDEVVKRYFDWRKAMPEYLPSYCWLLAMGSDRWRLYPEKFRT